MPIVPIDEINLTALTQTTNSTDPTHLLDFLVNEASVPFPEMFIIVIMSIAFAGMKVNNYDTLDACAAVMWLGSAISGMFLFMNLISESWLLGTLAISAFLTFVMWYRNRN